MSKNMRIPCPDCERTLKVPPEHVERQVRCKYCQHVFLVPKYLELKCPTCQHQGRVRAVNVGRLIKCKRCGGHLHAVGGQRRKANPSLGPVLGVSMAELGSGSGPLLSLSSSASIELTNATETDRLRNELSARTAESFTAFQELGEAIEKNQRLGHTVQDLEHRLAEARETADREPELRAEADRLRSRVAQLESDLAQRTAVQRLPLSDTDEASELWAHLAANGQALEAERSERDALEQELRERAAEVRELVLRLERSEAEIEGLRKVRASVAAEARGSLAVLAPARPESDKGGPALDLPALDRDALESAARAATAEARDLRLRLELSVQEHEATRSERDRLAAELEAAAAAAAELRALVGACQTAQAENSSALQEAQAAVALATELRKALEAAEAQLKHEQTEALAERQSLNAQLDALNHRFDEGCHALQEEIQRLRDETERLRTEHQNALRQAEELARERDQVIAERPAPDTEAAPHQAALKEAVASLEQSRRQQAEIEQRFQELRIVLAHSVVDQERMRTHHTTELKQYECGLAAMRQEIQEARAEWASERARLAELAEQARAEVVEQLAAAHDRLDAATDRAARLQHELKAAHEQMQALSQIGGLKIGDGPVAFQRARQELAQGATTQERIEELSSQLSQARRETAQLRSILDYLGIEDQPAV
jgi:hypothetical protein